MGDGLREHLRAAQAAELAGNDLEAAQLLEMAAELYSASGSHARAESLRRHAAALRERSVEKVSAASPWIERGPTLADPSQEAWCSFCCRPRKEVGALVAGPAGAFLCRGCTVEAGRLLSGASLETSHVDTTEELSKVLPQNAAAWAALRVALAEGCRCVALVGAAGSGVDEAFQLLEANGWGTCHLGPGWRAPWALARDGQVLVGGIVEVSAPGVSLTAKTGEQSRWVGHEALVLAVGEAWASRVDRVIRLVAPSSADLREEAVRVLAARPEVKVSPRLLEAWIVRAAAAGLGARQLTQWVSGLPPGDWDLEGA